MDQKLSTGLLFATCLLLALNPVVVDSNIYEWGRVESGEYCDYESFEASCGSGEHIMIASAQYGHMSQGKCVKLNTGLFGCNTDVSGILQEKCAGKRTCSVDVRDKSLRATAPCTAGILVYLKAAYMCVKAVPDATLCTGVSAQPGEQYISSSQAQAKHCTRSTGLFDQEYRVSSQPGQQLTFSLINLDSLSGAESRQDQTELGYILATDSRGSEKVYPITQHAADREVQVAVTDSNTATVVLSSVTKSHFLMAFRAHGCADLKLNSDVSITRVRDKATVSCHNSPQTWELRCINTHWTGVIGNCTAAIIPRPVIKLVEEYSLPLPRDIIFAIIGCTTFFIGVLVVTVGYVCLKWPKRIGNGTKQNMNILRFGTVKHMRVPSNTTTDTSTLYLTPRIPPEAAAAPSSGDYQPIWEKPLPKPPNNDQINIAGNSKRNNEDVYNMSLSSNSTDYEKKKYFVLDKDYMNTAELQQAMA